MSLEAKKYYSDEEMVDILTEENITLKKERDFYKSILDELVDAITSVQDWSGTHVGDVIDKLEGY